MLAPVAGKPLTWTTLVAGNDHTCALASDHTAWCWGDNLVGELGNGSPISPVSTPQPVNDQAWSGLSAGGVHTCGRLDDGRLRCWGSNGAGQLGIVGVSSSSSPSSLDADDADWVAVAAGAAHTCAAKTDGSLWCWGDNGRGQTGGPRITSYDPVPHTVAGGAISWAQLAAAGPTCGIGDDHNLWCLGLGAQSETTVRAPARLPGSWKHVSAGSVSTCAIDDTSALFCWGNNYAGQLGDSSYRSAGAPKQVAGPGWVAISVGSTTACAIREGGELGCWGSNFTSLGDGSTTRLTPTRISNRSWAAVAVGSSHTCAIEATTGLLSCWGSNYYGELGTGDNVVAPLPTPVTSQVWTSIAAGGYYTCGVGNAGVQCWGLNATGDLGNGTYVQSLTPIPIGVGEAVAVRSAHSCSLAGTALSCWGLNLAGQLGDGTMSTSPIPVAVGGAWLQVAVGSAHSCAIAVDHSLWCWGDNSRGAVGDGSMELSRGVPTRVGDQVTWQSVTAGDGDSCGLRSDGSLWCWGDNMYGQLGIGVAIQSALVLVL